jgi:TPR repeat protein
MNKKLLVCAALAALFAAGPVLPQTAVPGASYDAPAAVAPASPADEEMAIALELFAVYKNDEAIQHLIAAAEMGNVGAQVMLGMMYLHGQAIYNLDIPLDVEAARTWLDRAALAGSTVAKFMLANLDLFDVARADHSPPSPPRRAIIAPMPRNR